MFLRVFDSYIWFNEALSIFMSNMNRIFWPFQDGFIVVFKDDILIYSRSPQDQRRIVLGIPRNKSLSAKPERCGFWLNAVRSQGHVISQARVSVDSSKVEVVLSLEQPTTITEERSFLGLVGYYQRFIRVSLVLPLSTPLTQKVQPFVWDMSYKISFIEVKMWYTLALALTIPNPNLGF